MAFYYYLFIIIFAIFPCHVTLFLMKLSARLCLYAAGICLGIFIAIALVMELCSARSESRQAERVTGLIQNGVVDNIVGRIKGVEEDVKRTGRGIMAMGREFTVANTERILSDMLRCDSIMKGGCIAVVPGTGMAPGEWMLYVQFKDSTAVATQLGGTDYGYTDQDWFSRPVAEGRPMWSPPYIDYGAGDCLMSTYTLPLFDRDGTCVAVVTADIDLSSLDEEIYALVPYSGAHTFILSDSGEVLTACPDPSADTYIEAGIGNLPPGSGRGFRRIERSGIEYLCCYTPVRGVGLTVCSATPVASVMSATSVLKLPLLIILGVGFLALILGLRMMLTRSMRPLARLTEAARKAGDGNFDSVLPEVGDNSDLRQLRDAMGYMQESIKQYIGKIEENTRESERMASQLDIARRIQRSMLPAPRAEAAMSGATYGITAAAMQQSALEVGGDLYDYLRDGDRFYFIIADVSGKGIPAALMMAYIKSLFHFAAQMSLDPAEILSKINESMCENNTSDMFATMLVGCVDLRDETVALANAGHNPAIIAVAHRTSGDSPSPVCTSALMLPPGLPAGIISGMAYTLRTMPFGPGCKLFMYTDGLTEAEDSRGIQFGQDRLLLAVSRESGRGASPEETVAAITAEVDRYCGSNPGDDITMLCIAAYGTHYGSGSDVAAGSRADEDTDNREWKNEDMDDSDCLSETLALKYDTAEIPRVTAYLTLVGTMRGWSDAMTMNLQLATEEAIANVTGHSVPEAPGDMIEVTFCHRKCECEVTVTDTGAPFNPVDEAPEVDVSLSAEDRKVGGLGLFLIRNLSETVTYRRDNGKNVLTFRLTDITPV